MAVVKDLIVLGNANVTGKISEEGTLLEKKYISSVVTSGSGTVVTNVTANNGVATAALGNVIPSNNVTGSGTSGYITKWTGTNTIGTCAQITSGGTGFLKQDGTWSTPSNTTYTFTTGTTEGAFTVSPSSGSASSVAIYNAVTATAHLKSAAADEIIVHDGNSNDRKVKTSGKTVVTAISASTNNNNITIPTSKAILDAITEACSASLVYKGTVDSTHPLPDNHVSGWLYVVG